jgi:hypothetical protein
VGEDFVGTIARKNLARLDAVVSSDGLAQHGGLRVRIELQPVLGRLLDRRDNPWRRRVRILVGIELDQVVELGLLTRHIWGEFVDDLAPILTHH